VPEVLARMRSDSLLARPAQPSRPAAATTRALFARLSALSPRALAGAALTAAFVGVAVNALLLQHERHPAPFFAPPPARHAAATAAPSPSGASDAAQAASPPPPPPVPPNRPSDLSANDPAAAARTPLTLDDLLRAEPRSEPQRLTLAAQNALIKLGYPLKADGVVGPALQQAVREFERARGLPASAEITPRLVKQLTLAAGAAGR
jgi:hypothetical protein